MCGLFTSLMRKTRHSRAHAIKTFPHTFGFFGWPWSWYYYFRPNIFLKREYQMIDYDWIELNKDVEKVFFLRNYTSLYRNELYFLSSSNIITLQKKEVYPWWKVPSKCLKVYHFFIYSKTQSCFFRFSFHATLFYSLMNVLVYVDIEQGIH